MLSTLSQLRYNYYSEVRVPELVDDDDESDEEEAPEVPILAGDEIISNETQAMSGKQINFSTVLFYN